jgi:hypothetical protein
VDILLAAVVRGWRRAAFEVFSLLFCARIALTRVDRKYSSTYVQTRARFGTELVCCPGNTFTSSFPFSEDRIRGGSPDERLRLAVGILDVVIDFLQKMDR